MNSQQSIEAEDEISIKEVVLKVKKLYRLLLSRWKFILIVCLFFAGLGTAVSLIYHPKYIATTTVALEQSNSFGGMLSGVASLASSFGLGGGTAGGEDKLLDILVSKNMVSSTLLSKATVDGKNDYLINHFLVLYDYREKLDEEEDVRLKGLLYTDSDLSKLSYVHDSIFNLIYEKIVEKPLLKVEKDNKSLVVTITVKTRSEDFSRYFSQKLIEATSKFYTEEITKKTKQTVAVIQSRTDSTFTALNIATDKYAKWKDASTRLIKMEGNIEEQKLMRDIQVLSLVYGELVKNLELAKLSLLNETPIFQIIDQPIQSLEMKEISLTLAIFVGLVIGGFFAACLLLAQNFYKEQITDHD